jgi:hypothetical protein
MRPIEFRADIEFLQALRCVEYRVPRMGRFQRPGYLAALGLRYGLVGIAATYHLLVTACDEDESCVLNATRSWPQLVEDHVRYELLNRFPFPHDPAVPIMVGQYAERPLRLALPMLHRLNTLDTCLKEVCEYYIAENIAAIRMNWPWYRRRTAKQEFIRCMNDSLSFTLHFFERRQYDLQEVPEIALLGE